MPRMMHTALLILGLLLVVAGAAVATLTGPDDTVLLGSHDPRAAAGAPVVTDPVVTAFTGVDLVVRASAPGGVFTGYAHQVDLADLLDGVGHREITDVRLRSLGGHSVEGTVALPDLAALDLWSDSASGEGVQELTVPLTGEPVGVLAAPAEPGQRMSLALGARVDGLFALSLGVAGLGALLLLLLLAARRHHNRTRPLDSGAVPPDHRNTSAPASVPRPRTGSTPSTVRMTVALISGGLMLSGCTLPASVAVEAPTKRALTPAQAATVVADYGDRLAVAARAASGPAYDTAKWQLAQTGPLLDAATFATSLNRLLGDHPPPLKTPRIGDHVYSGAFSSYPLWAVVEVSGLTPVLPRAHLTEPDQKEKKGDSLLLLTRETVTEPWRAAAASAVLEELPEPAAEAGVPADQAQGAARRAAQALHTWWSTGSATGVEIDRDTVRLRKSMVKGTKGASFRIELNTSVWPERDLRLQVVEVSDGYLAMSVANLRVDLIPEPGVNLSWKDGWETVHGASDKGIYRSRVVTSVIHLPTQGSPRVLGSSLADRLS